MAPRPRKQGNFDGACGFYAVANALSLLSPRNVDEDDFSVLLHALAPETGLPRQFFVGTGRNELNRMLSALLRSEKFDSIGVHRPFWSSGKVSLGDYWRTLTEHFDEGNRAAIIGFAWEPSPREYYSHWTVVRAVTAASLLLHDSDPGGKTRISRKRARIWDEREYHSTRPYALDHSATFLLWSDEE